MSRKKGKRANKTGLSPGTLIHIGERKIEDVKITLVDYDQDHLEEKVVHQVEECFPFINTDAATWLQVHGLHQVEVIKTLGERFGIHALVLEDILNTEQRPKLEDFEQYIFIVLKIVNFVHGRNEIAADQLSIILGSNFLISFHERENGIFQSVRERIRSGKGRLRNNGVDYLAFALLDSVVDHYFVILDTLQERIEDLEERLIVDSDEHSIQDIHELRREVILLRKSVWPLRELISAMQRQETPLITDFTDVYLRDLYDHVMQVIDTVEVFRELLASLLEIYLTSISNRMNAVMKVLTMIATIFIPLTFIAGIYGMNFEFMPELHWRWAYPLVWGVMLVLGAVMLIYFKRKKWL
jgi:magnesium transporter